MRGDSYRFTDMTLHLQQKQTTWKLTDLEMSCFEEIQSSQPDRQKQKPYGITNKMLSVQSRLPNKDS